MGIPGMQVLRENSQEPLRQIPSGDLTGMNIALKMYGGIGDSLMAIGGLSKRLDERGAFVTAVVSDRQQKLMAIVEGVSNVATILSYNNPAVMETQDVFIDFQSTFNAHRELRAADYYDLVSTRAGMEATPGSFKDISWQPWTPPNSVVCIHPSASNINRRWQNFKWEELAYQLRGRGLKVNFIGTRDEFGFTDADITKHSDEDIGLIPQIKELSRANLFVGCDSGFAHVAGMLGVPGCVLLGNTEEDHILARYEKLTGVDAYDVVGYGPTRSLRTDCEKSINAMAAIEVDDVLKALKVDSIEYKDVRKRRPREAEKMTLAIVGLTDQALIMRLRKLYDVHVFGNIPRDTTRFDAMLVALPDGQARIHRKGDPKGVVVRLDDKLEQALQHLTTE